MDRSIAGRYSVIIPTWNRSYCIRKAISSVLRQTVPPLEILVCDDGSDDDTERIVRQFQDPLVRWCPGPRGGRPAIPRNRGMRECRGEWIAFLDSDDYWLPEKIEKQLLLARQLDCRAASTNAYRVAPNQGICGSLVSWNKTLVSFSDLLYSNIIVCSSALIHSSLLPKITGFPDQKELTALEDYALWLRVLTQTDIAFVSHNLVVYHDDPKTSIRNEGLDAQSQRNVVFRNFEEWAASEHIGDPYISHIRKALRRQPANKGQMYCNRLLSLCRAVLRQPR